MCGSKTVRFIIMLAVTVLFICQAYAAEFSADLFLAQPGDSITAKIYVRDHLYRVENFEGRNKFLAIENRLTDTTTAMNPEEMTYLNLAGPAGAFSNPVKGWEYNAVDTEEKDLGVETVNGFECDHYSYAYQGAEEAHLEMWKSKKLDHFIKYVVHYGASGDGVMELRNVVEGPQDDALFKIPDGYTREKSADEIEMERPAVTATESSTAPVGRRLAAGGELIVKVDPELSVRIKMTNLIKDTSICHVHAYKNGQKILVDNISPPENETFVIAYKGRRAETMFGMQNKIDEIRVKLEKGRVMATVMNEYSSFDDVRKTQYYIAGVGQGIGGIEGRPMHLKITGDSPAAEKTSVKIHVYEQNWEDGMEQKNTVEELEFDLKNGEEKTLEYSLASKANYVLINVDEAGGIKLILSQPPQ